MRVIAGELRGRRLKAPRGTSTRPTSDRVREALFSSLGEVSGSRVLDLFAGSGALGIEALSRGASHAVFVDSSASATAVISDNLMALDVSAVCEVVRMPALRALACTPVCNRRYDLVFLDPPYRQAGPLGPALSLALLPLLAAQARVVAESDRREPLQLDLPLHSERRYGDTLIRVHVLG
jgi:16S rRNA (guanine966-N2)-methyltransferase